MNTTDFSWRRTPIDNVFDVEFIFHVLDFYQNWTWISRIYHRLIQTKGMAQTFWGFDNPTAITFPEFLATYQPQGDNRIIAITYDLDIVGMLHLSDFNRKHRVNGSIWVEPKWRGKNGWVIGRQVLYFVHLSLGFDNMYSVTPWESAKQFCTKAGMWSVATIPRFSYIKGEGRDAEVFWSSKANVEDMYNSDQLHRQVTSNGTRQEA